MLNKFFSKQTYTQFQIIILGIFSAMPLIFVFSTSQAWFKDYNLDISLITSFAVARIPYSLKPLVAPLMDSYAFPFFSLNWKRRSWIIFFSFMIAFLYLVASFLNPAFDLNIIYFVVILMGVSSACLDINIDALRIDMLPQELQTLGAANAVLGYRLGMLISGGLTLYFVDICSWGLVFRTSAISYIAFLFYITTFPEADYKTENNGQEKTILEKIKDTFFLPLYDFFSSKPYAVLILFAIMLYKIGEAFFGVVTMIFYKELGFTNQEIGAIVKTYGLFATIAGGYAGSYVMYKFGNYKGLIINAGLQSVTNFSFVWLHHQGHDLIALTTAIMIENVASGMGSAALVGFASALCNKNYSATQYALLTSTASLCNNTIVIYGGDLVKILGWDYYFSMTVFLGLPGIVLLYYISKKLEAIKLNN